MLDGSITELKFEDQHDKADEEQDEPELDADSVQYIFEQQTYREHSITDECDNVISN